jgi:L-lactate permease
MQKSDAKMKKLFGHKYILRIVAFVVLAIAVVNISLPKIEEYNSAVHEQQNKLKIEANGDNSILGIGIYVFIEGNFNFVFTIILIALFLSLLLGSVDIAI